MQPQLKNDLDNTAIAPVANATIVVRVRMSSLSRMGLPMFSSYISDGYQATRIGADDKTGRMAMPSGPREAKQNP